MAGLSEKLFQAYLADGRLYAAHLDLTYRCPLRCRHCYLEGRRADEMTTGQWLTLLADLADMGVFRLLFSGGEVFLRQDLMTLLEAARNHRFGFNIKTSGAPADEAVLKQVASLGPGTVDISFYAHTAPVHDSVTGVRGSFQSSLRTALFLQMEGVRVRAVATLLKGYSEDASKLTAGLEKLGVEHVTANMFEESMCAAGDLSHLNPPEGALVEQWRPYAESLESAGDIPEPKSPGDLICKGLAGGIYVTPDGTVYPCVRLPTSAGNVLESPVARVWESSRILKRVRSMRWRDLPECIECPANHFCYFCPGAAWEATGELTSASPKLCQIAECVSKAVRLYGPREREEAE